MGRLVRIYPARLDKADHIGELGRQMYRCTDMGAHVVSLASPTLIAVELTV